MNREQTQLFIAADDGPTTGVEGLLRAIVRQGLDPDALEIAATLVLELDRQARERNRGEAAA